MRHPFRSAAILSLLLCVSFTATAGADVAEFYKGKTLRFILGSSPGGGFDTYARTIARTLTKHIPGTPKIIVQNMPGAGFAIAMNYLYNVAKRDGSVIGATNSGLVMKQVLGEKGIRFDNAKFGWLGSAGKATPTCMVMSRTGATDLEGILNAPKPINFGSAGTLTRDTPLILRDFVGGKINVVRGYNGTAQIRAAVGRKEVDGYCSSWESVRIQATEMLKGKEGDRLIPFLTSGDKEEPVLKDLPLFADHIKNADERAAYEAWLAPYKLFRAYVTPPGIPEERLKALQTAFRNTLDDPEFIEASRKIGIEISYLSGAEIQSLVKQVFSIGPGAEARLKQLVGAK
ncbi:MAG: tripartite tricarboxylate transporter substrate-binding protein [Deltaproteobacteria bacterium]|nr:tripartite tricarboxylate transporter substrate-binding protein [Deltaproteobacteria bacterium]